MKYSINGTGKIGHLEKSKIRPFPHIVYTHTHTHTHTHVTGTHNPRRLKIEMWKKNIFLSFRKEKYRRIFYTISIRFLIKFLSRYINYNYKGKFCNVEIHWNLKLLSDKDFCKWYLKDKLQTEKRFFFILLKYSWFTMYSFLLYNKWTQLYIHIFFLILFHYDLSQNTEYSS